MDNQHEVKMKGYSPNSREDEKVIQRQELGIRELLSTPNFQSALTNP